MIIGRRSKRKSQRRRHRESHYRNRRHLRGCSPRLHRPASTTRSSAERGGSTDHRHHLTTPRQAATIFSCLTSVPPGFRASNRRKQKHFYRRQPDGISGEFSRSTETALSMTTTTRSAARSGASTATGGSSRVGVPVPYRRLATPAPTCSPGTFPMTRKACREVKGKRLPSGLPDGRQTIG